MLRLRLYLYQLAQQAQTGEGNSFLGGFAYGLALAMQAYAEGGPRAVDAHALRVCTQVGRKLIAVYRGRDLRGKIVMMAAWLILFSALFGVAYGVVSLLRWLLF